MPSFSVRPASPLDVPAIHALIAELAEFEKAPHEFVATTDTLSEVLFGSEPWVWAWVAEVNAEVVGTAIVYRRYSTWKGPVLYLEDFVVQESHRSQGIGGALFETCLDFAREKNFSRMVWQVLDWNQEAHRFYQRYGAWFDAGWWNAGIDLST